MNQRDAVVFYNEAFTALLCVIPAFFAISQRREFLVRCNLSVMPSPCGEDRTAPFVLSLLGESAIPTMIVLQDANEQEIVAAKRLFPEADFPGLPPMQD